MDSKVKFNVYAAYMCVDHERRIHPISASEQPRLAVWAKRDFIIYSKVIRDSRHIFCQVLLYTCKYDHPFSLETYVKKKKSGIEKDMWMDKEARINMEEGLKRKRCTPFYSGAQGHWSDCPGPNTPFRDNDVKAITPTYGF